MLRGFDLFHQHIRLNYNQSNRFTTNAGCFFTICVFVITLSQAILTFNSILNFESPQVTIDRILLKNPGSISLNSSEFIFAVKIPNLNLSSSFISLQMSYYKFVHHGNGTYDEIYTPFPYKRCSLEYMQNYIDSDTFQSQNFGDAFCPDTTSFQFSGSYRDPMAEAISISISACRNNTNHPEIICKPKEEIADFFKNNNYPYVQFWYSNTIVSPTNHSNPVSYYLDMIYWHFLPGSQTIDTNVYINEHEIITDDNLLLANWNLKNQSTYQIVSTEMRSQPTPLVMLEDNSELLISIGISKSSYKDTTRRLYPKLQQGLANVGSVFSLAVGVCGAIAAVYVGQAYLFNIAKHVYEFDAQDTQNEMAKSKKVEKTNSSKGKKHAVEMTNASLSLQDMYKKGIKEGNICIGREAATLFPKKRVMKYNCVDFLLSFIPCVRRKRNLLINEAISAVSKDIDIIEIVKKLQEFERLKKILLDEDELLMLKYSQAPIISLQSAKQGRDTQERKHKVTKKRGKNDNETESSAKSAKYEQNVKEKSDSVIQHGNSCTKNSGQNDALSSFADSFRCYNRLLQKVRSSEISRKILTLMDPQSSDAFFEFRMKYNSIKRVKQAKRKGHDVFERNERGQKMSKLEAGLIISKHLENYYFKRQKKKSRDLANVTSFPLLDEQNNHEDFSISSEKHLVQPETRQPEIPNNLKQELHSHTKAIQLTKITTSLTPTNVHNVSPRSNQIESEVPHPPSKQGQNPKGRLPPIVSFPRTSASDSYFE